MILSGSIHVAANDILFYDWVVFHCIYIVHLLYPCIVQWTFRLFPCVLAIVSIATMNIGVHLIVVLICITLLISDVEYLSYVSVCHPYVFFGNVSLWVFLSFFNGVGVFFFFFGCWVVRVLCIFWMLTPYQMYHLRISSQMQ